MAEFKELLGFAKRIKERKLQKLVTDALRHPALANKSFKYPTAKFQEAPGSVNWHHTQTGGLVEHTYAVTLMAIRVAETLEKTYKVKLDMDALIAAALVHDIGKLWTTQKTKRGWEPTTLSLDHTMLGTSELYARGFPEKVVHIVASHFGPNGPTPPQTVEAVVFHAIDNLDAMLGGQAAQAAGQEEILKMLGLG
ncbi:MAG: HD domain-containing protein [Candidatus Aenigmatarchaeota archaeon]